MLHPSSSGPRHTAVRFILYLAAPSALARPILLSGCYFEHHLAAAEDSLKSRRVLESNISYLMKILHDCVATCRGGGGEEEELELELKLELSLQ